jgi:hypothetical protein
MISGPVSGCPTVRRGAGELFSWAPSTATSGPGPCLDASMDPFLTKRFERWVDGVCSNLVGVLLYILTGASWWPVHFPPRILTNHPPSRPLPAGTLHLHTFSPLSSTSRNVAFHHDERAEQLLHSRFWNLKNGDPVGDSVSLRAGRYRPPVHSAGESRLI